MIEALDEQIRILQLECGLFDAGNYIIGRRIAAGLRLLLNHWPPNQQSLLGQLGLRDDKFWDTARALHVRRPGKPELLSAETPLLYMIIDGAGGRLAPVLAGQDSTGRWVKFVDWWSQVVVRDIEKRKFTRMELVLAVANTDGGTHVDPDLDLAYEALSRRNSVGWMFSQGDQAPHASTIPVALACVRQIAYETLYTLGHRPDAVRLLKSV